MSKFILLLSLVLFPAFSLHAVEEEYENKRVARIEIEAKDLPQDSVFDTEAIEHKLKTRAGSPFSQDLFDQDLKTLSKDYDRVDPTIRLQNDEVYVNLKIRMRPIIKAIVWKGDFHFRKKKLEKELGVQAGTLFNRQSFNKSFRNLKEFYVKKGFFEALLTYRLISDPFSNGVTVEIDINEGRSGLIKKVIFEGFTKEEKARLEEKMHIKPYNVLLAWYTHRGIYHEELIDYDKMEILRFLRDEGFANAKVEIEVRETIQKSRIYITLKADKGERYAFGDVSFEGNGHVNDEAIRNLISVKKGAPYSPQQLQETVSGITDFYGAEGFIDATVSYHLHLDPDKNLYTVSFKIDEGSPYKVGLIKILGNYRTKSKVILHETLLEPGNTFDSNRLEATQKRLENIGYYKHVNVYASPSSSLDHVKASVRDVNIEVEETSTGNMGIFFGFSSVDNVFGGLELTEKNFNLGGLFDIPAQGISALRGGGEYLRIKTGLGTKLNDYSLNWTKPYVLDTPWTLGVNLDKNFNRMQSNNYSLESFTTNVHTFYPFNAFLNASLYYRMRNLHLHVDAGSPEPLFRQEDNNGVVSAVGFSFLYNSTNNPYRATRGFASDLRCEYAGVGGNFFFFQFNYNNAYYIPFTKRLISKTRVDFDFIIPVSKTKPDSVPMGERFYLVGDVSSVRGYRPYAIGPQFKNRPGEPQGGISAALLSQEFLFNLLPGIDLFVFVDAGSLSLKPFDVNVLRASTGVGARVTALSTLPLMLGWGYPINPKNRTFDTQGFFISMGGKF